MINLEELQKNKKLTIRNFGTFFLKPARKGEINGLGKGTKPRYNYRITFKPSDNLKEKICK